MANDASATEFTEYAQSNQRLAIENSEEPFFSSRSPSSQEQPQHAYGDFALENGQLLLDGQNRLTFSGVAVYAPSLFKGVLRGSVAKLGPLLKEAIMRGQATAFHHQGVWLDIGTPERLQSLDAELRGQA